MFVSAITLKSHAIYVSKPEAVGAHRKGGKERELLESGGVSCKKCSTDVAAPERKRSQFPLWVIGGHLRAKAMFACPRNHNRSAKTAQPPPPLG
jgi:hypothetical protein